MAGFLLASKGHIDFSLLLAFLGGISLVIASACVFNNYIDRDIDAKMSRTKNRALVKGTVSNKTALIYGTALGILGFAILVTFTNWLTVLGGLIGWAAYIFGYSFAKRSTVHSTLIGTVPGAMPIVAGYVVVTNRFDIVALLLFIILVCWQMPHFFSIGIRRYKEYKAANLPVLPVKRGIRIAKAQILYYVLGFMLATILLGILGHAGKLYLIVIAAVGSRWLWLGLQGPKAPDNTVWAKKMFLFSLVVLLSFCFMISINAWVV